jgi:predicted helicase
VTKQSVESKRNPKGLLRRPSGTPRNDGNKELTKWDIFYYVYGLLHHPEYRLKYAANLRRELPRIPISPDFWAISECGKQLAALHVNYESAAEYDLKEVWAPGSGLNFRVEKMKLMKDKSAIIYNEDLMLTGIPSAAFEYRLGNRSAIDWIIDQYQISTDKRSGIVNDPNREDDPQYIVSLLKRVVTVSLETVRLVGEIAKTSLGQ